MALQQVPDYLGGFQGNTTPLENMKAAQTQKLQMQSERAKVEQKKKYDAERAEMYASGNVDLGLLGKNNPEMIPFIEKENKFVEAMRSQEAFGAASRVYEASQLGDPNMMVSILRQHAGLINGIGDPNFTDEAAIQMASTPEGMQQLGQMAYSIMRQSQGPSAYNMGQAGGKGAGVSTKSYAPMTHPETGEVFIPTYDAESGEASFVPVSGGMTQLTPQQKADIGAKSTVSTKQKTLAESRTSELKTQLGDRNRNASNSQIQIREALKLAQNASQGMGGELKNRLGRIFPNIDVSNEAALDAALNQLAITQLQQFTGPTTDFEFAVVRKIVGALGDSKTANVARLKALDRNRWMMQREYDQFIEYSGGDNDPDRFEFNYHEPININGRMIPLSDIHDTAMANHMTIEETMKALKSGGR